MKNRLSPGTVYRLLLLLLWLGLFGALLQRDYFVRTLDSRETAVLERDRQEDFLGIYFRNERIGFVKNRLLPAENGIRLEQTALMHLNILEQTYPVRLEVAALLTAGLELREFDFSLQSPFSRMRAEGWVDGTLVRFRLTSDGEASESSIRLADPPLLATNRRGYLLGPDLAPGDKFRVPYFDPVTLAARETLVEYKGREKELIKGRVHVLHRFTETFAGVRINTWLDDHGKVIKEESPAGFVFLAEPEFKATDIVARGREILSSVAVPLAGAMPDLAGRQELRFQVRLPEEAVQPLTDDRQRFAGGILTVVRERLPTPEAAPCTGAAGELAATPYVQATHPEIVSKAAEIAGNAVGGLDQVRQLAVWVYDNLEKRPVLGIPDALATLRAGIGDCNEHAALFAALARSRGIPTRIVAGVTLQNGAFYYHAWNEVCLASGWLSVDTTRNQLPADLTHLKFVEGETGEQIRIGSLLGRLQIEVLENE